MRSAIVLKKEKVNILIQPVFHADTGQKNSKQMKLIFLMVSVFKACLTWILSCRKKCHHVWRYRNRQNDAVNTDRDVGLQSGDPSQILSHCRTDQLFSESQGKGTLSTLKKKLNSAQILILDEFRLCSNMTGTVRSFCLIICLRYTSRNLSS